MIDYGPHRAHAEIVRVGAVSGDTRPAADAPGLAASCVVWVAAPASSHGTEAPDHGALWVRQGARVVRQPHVFTRRLSPTGYIEPYASQIHVSGPRDYGVL